MEEKILIKGMSVSEGIISGKARVIKEIDDIEKAENGDIIILPNSHPMYAMAVLKAGGVICEAGGMLSHICIVSLEMGIPCITQAEGAAKVIQTGQNICLDSKRGIVYGA